jgi:hypothetical protein
MTQHTRKESWGIAPLILNIGKRWRSAQSITTWPLYSREWTRLPIEWDARLGPRAGLDDLEKGKISCLYQDSYPGPPIPQPVTIPTILTWFLWLYHISCENKWFPIWHPSVLHAVGMLQQSTVLFVVMKKYRACVKSITLLKWFSL